MPAVADVVVGQRPDRRAGGDREARAVGDRHGVVVARPGDAVLVAQAIAHLVEERSEVGKVAVDHLDRADVAVHRGGDPTLILSGGAPPIRVARRSPWEIPQSRINMIDGVRKLDH